MSLYPMFTGIPGSGGLPGPSGKNAYQIAVDDGYTGTEQEWLQSLHGQNGKDGASVSIDGQVATYAELPSVAQNGDGWLVDDDGLLYVYANGFPADGAGVEFRGEPGLPGYNGRNVEIQNNGTYVQWRLVGDADNLKGFTITSASDLQSIYVATSGSPVYAKALTTGVVIIINA